ncbi:hypothetical protein EAS62_15490 [Bradyrhizobium zhanjiangense]|uniref:Uncharacterized protein n=1 Tax=Bradyrhizobium zhanjiangense TaxID=1325107 RepID=A0ABY0DNN2_9BRAD|nr:hypothetical protein EAS62_15490 [Bradyrhizobium zhanjiangense]
MAGGDSCGGCGFGHGDFSPSSLRAQRSNPESFRGGSLDCFAALAMTEYVVRSEPRNNSVARMERSAIRESRRWHESGISLRSIRATKVPTPASARHTPDNPYSPFLRRHRTSRGCTA